MAAAQQVQTLLRFLSKDAKLPLATAMSKINTLRKADITTPELIAAAKLEQLQSIFGDEKSARAVSNAAKRLSKKKRSAPEDDNEAGGASTANKRTKTVPDARSSDAELEASLALPDPVRDEKVLSTAVVYTNRAPLVLAFAVSLLTHTMPSQPLSSRLSLAQAVVSVNSRSKAISLGLEGGRSAEEEGWGAGQPVVRIMGRDVRVMRRMGYVTGEDGGETQDTEATVKGDADEERPLWGIDLEALKKSNTHDQARSRNTGVGLSASLPIYTPQSARAYLLKSFDSPAAPPPTTAAATPSSPTKKKQQQSAAAAAKLAERERNLAMLLGALDLLFASWAGTLAPAELDRRACGWYVSVRPEVKDGVAGWGGKGDVRLADILALRRG